jgi:hypothetical protein
MISLGFANTPEKQLKALLASYAELPRHLARKHLQASMRRAIKDGVPVLRSLTPPVGTRRGRRRKGEKRTTGKLRRSVTTKAKMVGRGSSPVVYGVVGYKASFESRKAIWLEYGTKAVSARHMVRGFLQRYTGPGLARLRSEMAVGLEKAASELAAGKNPGRA